MIAKQTIGKAFRGCLNYLFGKEGMERIGSNMLGQTPCELTAEFLDSCRLNPKVSRAVYHVSLSLQPGETLSPKQWHRLALDYLQGMGFTDNPYVVVAHHDTAHEHIHLVASRIRNDGTTVSDSWNYRRSEKLIRQLERQYQLKPVPQSKSRLRHRPTTGEIRGEQRTGQISSQIKLNRPTPEHER